MLSSMADIYSATAEIRREKKIRKKKNKRQEENIIVCPIPYTDQHLTSHCTKKQITSEIQRRDFADNCTSGHNKTTSNQEKIRTCIQPQLQQELFQGHYTGQSVLADTTS